MSYLSCVKYHGSLLENLRKKRETGSEGRPYNYLAPCLKVEESERAWGRRGVVVYARAFCAVKSPEA